MFWLFFLTQNDRILDILLAQTMGNIGHNIGIVPPQETLVNMMKILKIWARFDTKAT